MKRDPHTAAPARARIALLTTFNTKCGVAAHSAQLRNGLCAAARARGVPADVLVLAEDTRVAAKLLGA